MIDVDRFKLVNDRYGHHAGDETLRAVARVLLESARRADIVARYGGEEFALVLPQTSAEEAAVLAERARQRVRALSVPAAGGPVRVTASFGVAGGVPAGDGWRTRLLRGADDALYEAKAAGRDRVVARELPS
jgi:diguanylate cyclase (GGDEF)-like protein